MRLPIKSSGPVDHHSNPIRPFPIFQISATPLSYYGTENLVVNTGNFKITVRIDEFTIQDCPPEEAIIRQHIDGKNYSVAFIAAGITELGI